MGRRSSIRRLPTEIREQVDRLVRDGHTIDEITSHLEQLGADVSRSAVGRYKKSMEEQLARFRQAQEVAGVWVKDLGSEPEGRVGRLLAQMLQTVAFQVMADMGDEDAATKPMDIALLARAIKDLEGAARQSMEREIKIRERTQKEAAEAVEEVAASAGLSAATVAQFRSAILGVAQGAEG